MKILVVHPKDYSTDFLSAMYAGKEVIQLWDKINFL
jgi:hypothetical protein